MIESKNNLKNNVLSLQRGHLCICEFSGVGFGKMISTDEHCGRKSHKTYVCFVLKASFHERNTPFNFVAVFGLVQCLVF